MTDRRRLWRAEHQNISILRNLYGKTYVVKGTRGKRYTVNLAKPSCECPDWQKRSPAGGCKHILKIKIKNGAIESPEINKPSSESGLSRSQSSQSNQPESEYIDSDDNSSVDTPRESDAQSTGSRSGENREVSETDSRVQKNQSNGAQPTENKHDEKSSVLSEGSESRPSVQQNSSGSETQEGNPESSETIGIVGSVWRCIALILLLTVVLPPTVTFTRWKAGISAGICSLLFALQLIGNNSSGYVRDVTWIIALASLLVAVMLL